MNAKTVSYVLHLLAGVVIVVIPIAIAGIPESWQAMTVGGVLGVVFKVAHDYAGL